LFQENAEETYLFKYALLYTGEIYLK